MTRSANEVMTLAAKAARGGGAPPAQAVDFGLACLRHLGAGRDPAALHAALDALPAGPILDLPLAFRRAVEGDGHAHVARHGGLARSYTEALPFAHAVSETADGLGVAIDTATPSALPPPGRCALPPVLVRAFEDLAALTYVPETEVSRATGAGAGVTDND